MNLFFSRIRIRPPLKSKIASLISIALPKAQPKLDSAVAGGIIFVIRC